ncbi:acid--CoA ligase, partial [Burkholderia multivorans]
PELLEAELAEVEELGRAAMEHRKPLLVHSMSADSQAVADMWARAVPCYRSIDTTMRVLSRAAFYSSHAGRIAEAFELSGTVTPWGRGYSAARETIISAGVEVPRAVTVAEVDALAEGVGAAELTPPFVLKAGWPA